MTDNTAYDAAIAYARDLGAEHGRNAASWVDLPDRQRARDLADALAGDLDSDPHGARADAMLEALPHADLSGEWAGELTGPQLTADAIAESGASDDDAGSLTTAVCDAYEEAFDDAMRAAVSRRARYVGGLAGAVNAWSIYATVGGRGVPTFYLLRDVQGTLTAESAERVARDILTGRGADGAQLLSDDDVKVTATATTL